MEREIITIDENLCDGCGLCVPACPEGALQIIDGKARLISDLFCDGLGACIGDCPRGAITIEKREAEPYDEYRVMENVVEKGENTIKAHLTHLKDHNEMEYYRQALAFLEERNIDISLEDDEESMEAKNDERKNPAREHAELHASGGCPGAKLMEFAAKDGEKDEGDAPKQQSQLRQWPVQIHLVPPMAPYLKDADLLIAADCVPFAYPDFHRDLLKGKTLLVGCPKLDDARFYEEKFTEIFKQNDIRSVTYAKMEVPCCSGMAYAIENAMKKSGKEIDFETVTVSIQGERYDS